MTTESSTHAAPDKLRWLYLIGILAGLIVTLYSYMEFRRTGYDIKQIMVAAGVGMTLFTAIGWLGSSELRKLLILMAFTGFTCLLVVETGIRILEIKEYNAPNPNLFQNAAKTKGVQFDGRSSMEILLAPENESMVVVFTSATEGKTIRLDSGQTVFPLGGIRNAETLFCNENGYWVIYNSDEFGFRNPAGILKDNNVLDVLFLGDSMAQASCVRDENAYYQPIRERFPRTVTLGFSGKGPLYELATLLEFISEKRVKKVFWFYYEGNDFNDLSWERNEPILMRYLNQEDFTQNIKQINDKLDVKLREGFAKSKAAFKRANRVGKKEGQIRNTGVSMSRKNNELDLSGLWRFSRLRKVIANYFTLYSLDNMPELYARIIRRANGFIKERGGEMVFIYLPAWERFFLNELDGVDSEKLSVRFDIMPSYGDYVRRSMKMRPRVLDIMQKEGVPVIDMVRRFNKVEDKTSLYPFGIGKGHFSHLGNRIIADEILSFLEKHPLDIAPDHAIQPASDQ